MRAGKETDMRKTLAAAALGLAMVGLVVGLASTGKVEAQTPSARGPIRIAFLAPLTGPLAPNGKDLVNGMQLFLEQQKYKIAGRQVQLIIEDDEGKPQTGLTKARSMVEGQGCHVLIGVI